MKKNYIKPVTKTVIYELKGAVMGAIASPLGIEDGGKDDGTHDADAPEMPAELLDEKKNQYSLW